MDIKTVYEMTCPTSIFFVLFFVLLLFLHTLSDREMTSLCHQESVICCCNFARSNSCVNISNRILQKSVCRNMMSWTYGRTRTNSIRLGPLIKCHSLLLTLPNNMATRNYTFLGKMPIFLNMDITLFPFYKVYSGHALL